jgi:hypothetical protein
MENTVSDQTGYRRPTAWVGWIVLASVLMCIAGLFNVITGLVAVFSDKIYVQGSVATVGIDVTGWGWFHIFWGLVLLATGFALYAGATWARVTAIFVVGINMVTQLMEMPAYPLWSLVILTLDLLVIWAVIVHGDELRERH